MRTVRLRETHVPGLYWGSDGRVYAWAPGVEDQCSRCGRWTQDLYRRSTERVCARHVQITTRTRIRVTTTFACRVYTGIPGELPTAKVLRRGDQLAVAGRPERHGRFDQFALVDCTGFVLVPRGRWAWV